MSWWTIAYISVQCRKRHCHGSEADEKQIVVGTR